MKFLLNGFSAAVSVYCRLIRRNGIVFGWSVSTDSLLNNTVDCGSVVYFVYIGKIHNYCQKNLLKQIYMEGYLL